MSHKQVSYQTSLGREHAMSATQKGIERWKLGKAFGLKLFEAQAYEATRAGQQTGSVVRYAVESDERGTVVIVGVDTVKWALKNPMTGVFKSVEKTLRAEDSGLERL